MKPKFKHDCDRCVFLGGFTRSASSIKGNPQRVDLYYCPDAVGGTVLSRESDEPSNYTSVHLRFLIGQSYSSKNIIEAGKRALDYLTGKLQGDK